MYYHSPGNKTYGLLIVRFFPLLTKKGLFSFHSNPGRKVRASFFFTYGHKVHDLLTFDSIFTEHSKSNLNNTTMSENNNFYTTSTPNNKVVNGSTTDTSSINENDEISPIKNLSKEQYLNSVNANSTLNGNTTTIIAEIEGEVKKKARPTLDKTYYIAKEILTTELTYKKDLDVINIVSYSFS